MSHRLAPVALCVALAACSPPKGKTCAQHADCGTGYVCSAGYCQTAVQTAIANGPAMAIATSSASFDLSSTPAGATFECSLDGGAFAACPAHLVVTGLADGAHTLDARARTADNVDATPATWAWVVDTTPPDTAIDGGPTGVVIGGVSIAFSSPEAGATFECSLDGAAWAACTSPQAFATPALGNHTFQVRAKDALGNADASPAQRSWGTAADTTITSQPPNPVASSAATFTFTASDASAAFECNLDGAGYAACTSPKSYTTLADASHTFQVRATGGGVADPSPASFTWTVDTTGPVVNLTSTPLGTQSENPSFSFSSPEGGVTFQCRIDGGAWGACTSPRSYVVPTDFAVGPHTFYVRGIDALLNPTASPASYAWTQAPETRLTWAPLAWTNRTSEKVAFSSTTPGATFQCQVDGAPYAGCASPLSLAVGNGPHTVNVQALYTSGVTYTDPTPATTTFSVSTTNALLNYNFEGANGTLIASTANGGQLGGYAATGSGAAAYSSAFSHGATGLSAAAFTAQEGSPPTNRGSVTLTGVRQVLQHDLASTDGAYTIAFWFNEHFPANTKSAASGLLPRLFTTFNLVTPGAGLEIYHDETSTQPPPWIVCWSSGPGSPSCNNAPDTATGTGHRLIIEYGNGTSGWLNELRIYVGESADTVRTLFSTSVSGASLFGPGIGDPILGRDWWGYVDDVRIWNTTFANHWPQ